MIHNVIDFHIGNHSLDLWEFRNFKKISLLNTTFLKATVLKQPIVNKAPMQVLEHTLTDACFQKDVLLLT